jgi:Restriction endonuclease/NACHT domain
MTSKSIGAESAAGRSSRTRRLGRSDQLLVELAELTESELQEHVIEPLLKRKGYKNVRDTSGPRERGKDLIATKSDDFGKQQLIGIQIKKIKITGSISRNNSLGALLNQLRQAMSEPILDPMTSQNRRVNRLLFFTPYPITTDVIETVQEQFLEAELRGLTIVDGTRLAEEIREHLPDAILKLSMEAQYRTNFSRSASVIHESAIAYELSENLSIDNIYVDTSLSDLDSEFWRLAEAPPKRSKPVEIYAHRSGLSAINEILLAENSELQCAANKDSADRENKTTKLRREKIEISPDSILPQVISSNLTSLINWIKDADQTLLGVSGSDDNVRDFLRRISIIRRVNKLAELWPLWNIGSQDSVVASGSTPQVSSAALSKIRAPLFIRGAPGAGKTTLLRRLAQTQAREPSAKQLPILIYLVRLHGRIDDECILLACIEELRNHGYIVSEKSGQASLKKKLRAGAFRIYLDGLDELGERASLALEAIRGMDARYPKANIVLSCRESFDAEWDEALTLKLTPFSELQLRSFVCNWFTAKPSAHQKLLKWVDANPNMKRIASTPLIAGLLCSLFESDAELPSTEVELYARRFELLLGKWEKAKLIVALPARARQQYYYFIMSLAVQMHKAEKRVVSYEDALEHSSSFRIIGYHRSPNSMLNDCINRGLLTQETLGGLSFGHLTYQEYLVADWLVRDNPTSFIARKIGEHWWIKVLEFYAAKRGDIGGLISKVSEKPVTGVEFELLNKLAEIAPFTPKSALHKLRTRPRA